MKHLIKIILLIFITSCSTLQKKTAEEFECKPINFNTDNSFTSEKGITYYVCNEFANKAINNYTIETVKNKYAGFLKQETTPTRNIHDTTRVDTIYKFFDNNTTISFYRAKHKDFLREFEVSDALFNLYGCVSVGMSKEAVKEQFNIKSPLNDTIRIGNEEKTAVFTFYFKKNKLNQIVSTPYID
jgi:hypothetical protein